MTARRKGWSEWTVRLVALLFVVQGTLLAFAPGAAAVTPARDQFGNVLCLAGVETGQGGTHRAPDGHANMMACCSLGCAMFAGTGSTPPAANAPVATFIAIATIRFTSYADRLAAVPESPRTSRGPPVAV